MSLHLSNNQMRLRCEIHVAEELPTAWLERDVKVCIGGLMFDLDRILECVRLRGAYV